MKAYSYGILWSFLAGMAAAGPAEPSIEFEASEDDNGLNVILSEDHFPHCSGQHLVRCGLKGRPRRTGFAHLFEHLMFQGSLHFDDDYFMPPSHWCSGQWTNS